MYVCGIDIGSTASKCIILDAEGRVKARALSKTGIPQDVTARNLFNETLEQVGLSGGDIACVTSTGYGRKNVSFRNYEITEISAHAKGARLLFPETRAVIDAGGQDCKAIRLDANGLVDDFAINDRCAAGTGRFLEAMSERLGVSLLELGSLALETHTDRVINSTCTVFAESEIVSLLADNVSCEEVAGAVCQSVVDRLVSLAHRVRLSPPITVTGGVFNNASLSMILSKKLSSVVCRPDDPQYIGALGAACFSLEHIRSKSTVCI